MPPNPHLPPEEAGKSTEMHSAQLPAQGPGTPPDRGSLHTTGLALLGQAICLLNSTQLGNERWKRSKVAKIYKIQNTQSLCPEKFSLSGRKECRGRGRVTVPTLKGQSYLKSNHHHHLHVPIQLQGSKYLTWVRFADYSCGLGVCFRGLCHP